MTREQWCGAAAAVALMVVAAGAAAGILIGVVILRALDKGGRR